MPLLLATLSPEDHRGGLEVSLATTPAERQEVERLRHRVYVEEMGLLRPDHPFVRGDRLVDPYDAYSSHLLLRRGGQPVGTVRVTEALNGPLELDAYTDLRQRAMAASTHAAELTRFMVLADQRGSMASPLLLYAATKLVLSGRSTHIVGAAKLGSLGRRYAALGLRTVSDESFVYGLTGCRYKVGAVDLGRPGSLRRRVQATTYASIKAACEVAPQLVLGFYRRSAQRRRPVPTTQAPATT